MVRKSKGVGLATVLMVGLLGNVPAAAALDLQGTRSTAMGGTLRAAPSSETALLLNPAGMSLSRAYVLSGLYQYRASDAASFVNASVVDSATKKLAAGLYYSFVYASPSRTLYNVPGGSFTLEETLKTHEAGLALSYPLASMLHLGVGVKYVNVAVEQPEGTPETAADDGASGVSMDMGAILVPFPSLHLAVTYSNAIPLDHETYPRLLGMGISYGLGTRLLAEFDTVLDFDRGDGVKASYHGGGEFVLAQRYGVRAGAMHDTLRDATYVTCGLGVLAQKVALDFALRQMVDGGAETMVAFSVRFFVQ
jgi:hypothetical protein